MNFQNMDPRVEKRVRPVLSRSAPETWELEPFYHSYERRYAYNPYEERFRWGGYFGYRPWADEYSARSYYRNRFGYHIRGGEPNFKGRVDGRESGWGPRGSNRTDKHLIEDVQHALAGSSLIDASGVRVEVDQGKVTLSGHVVDRKSRRIAELICANIVGVKDVLNNLEY